MRLRTLAALVFALLPAAVASDAGAYRVEGREWPDGLIPYYSEASDQAWAVARAVNAWNTSGARIRFVAVSRRSARLVIRSTGRASCARAHATVGYVAAPRIWIWKRGADTSRCNRYWAAGALAHELGHVLGLTHEDRGCAAMNSRGSRRGPSRCERAEPWAWRCRLLEHDDVTGAVAVYGGAVRRPRADPTCDLYHPIAQPQVLAATIDHELGLLRVSLRRPAAPPIPAFLAPRAFLESYVRIWAEGPCPAKYDEQAPRYRWHADAGDVTELVQRVPRALAPQCLSIWAVDGLGRPSSAPASVRLTE